MKANALKVATLVAMSRAVRGEELAVTPEDIEKGAAMALESATTTVDGAMKHRAGSEFEENCKTVLRANREGGRKGESARPYYTVAPECPKSSLGSSRTSVIS